MRKTWLALRTPGPLGLGGGGLGSEADWTPDSRPCKLIPVPTAAPVGTGPCPGVRPGAIVQSDAGQCTFNFRFIQTAPVQ